MVCSRLLHGLLNVNAWFVQGCMVCSRLLHGLFRLLHGLFKVTGYCMVLLKATAWFVKGYCMVC